MLLAVWKPDQPPATALAALAHTLPPNQPWSLDLVTLRRTSFPPKALFRLRSSTSRLTGPQTSLLIRSVDPSSRQLVTSETGVLATCADKQFENLLLHHLLAPSGPWLARQSPLHLSGFQTSVSDFDLGIGALYFQSQHSQATSLGILIAISWKPRPDLQSSPLLKEFLASFLPAQMSSLQILEPPNPVKDEKYQFLHALVHYLATQGLA